MDIFLDSLFPPLSLGVTVSRDPFVIEHRVSSVREIPLWERKYESLLILKSFEQKFLISVALEPNTSLILELNRARRASFGLT